MRVARGLLHWSVLQLSEKSGIHRHTIASFEAGKSGGDRDTLVKLRRSLEAADVIFLEENGSEEPGVRLRKKELLRDLLV